jgi:hypothetical protein
MVVAPPAGHSPLSLDIEPETRLRQLLVRARTDETPADTTSDSGVEGGVDAPHESTEDDPQGAAGQAT